MALLWIPFFLWLFFETPLQNKTLDDGRILTRWVMWELVPYILLSVVDEARPHSGWMYLPQRADMLGIGMFIVAAAWGLGRLLLRFLNSQAVCRELPRDATIVEDFVLAAGLGLSGLSLLTLGCGLLGLLFRPLLGGLLGLALVAGIVDWWRAGPSLNISTPRGRLRQTAWFMLTACLLPFLVCLVLAACLPSTDFDSKAYHYVGPKEFYQNGRIGFLSHNVYTNFPFCAEMLTLLAMVLRQDWFRGVQAGQVVLMTFGPLTSLALYALGCRLGNSRAGFLAAIIYFTTPWTFRVSTVAHVEGALCFYVAATLLALLRAWGMGAIRSEIPSSSSSGTGLRGMFLVGLLAGTAMACKYPGLFSVVIPIGAAVFLHPWLTSSPVHPASRWKPSLQALLIFAVGVSCTVGPWLLKNLIETGNPVYPLAYNVFGGRDLDSLLYAKWQRGHSSTDFSFRTIVTGLWEVTARNDWLSPALFALAPLTLLRLRRHDPESHALLGLWLYLGWLFATWWGLTHRIDRFWVPQLPVVALLAGLGATTGPQVAFKPLRSLLVILVLISSGAFNLSLILAGMVGNNQFFLDLNVARQKSANHKIASLNAQLRPLLATGQPVRVLCVGEAEVFDAEFPVVYNSVFDRSIFEEWCANPQPGDNPATRAVRDPASIRRKLSEHGITHIYINWLELLRYRTTYGYTDFVSPERFIQLQNSGVLGDPWAMPTERILVKDLGTEAQREVRAWGRRLVQPTTIGPAIPTMDVFPVNR